MTRELETRKAIVKAARAAAKDHGVKCRIEKMPERLFLSECDEVFSETDIAEEWRTMREEIEEEFGEYPASAAVYIEWLTAMGGPLREIQGFAEVDGCFFCDPREMDEAAYYASRNGCGGFTVTVRE